MYVISSYFHSLLTVGASDGEFSTFHISEFIDRGVEWRDYYASGDEQPVDGDVREFLFRVHCNFS